MNRIKYNHLILGQGNGTNAIVMAGELCRETNREVDQHMGLMSVRTDIQTHRMVDKHRRTHASLDRQARAHYIGWLH